MKKALLSVMLITALVLILGSCQNESTTQELNKNSTLTTLLMRVTHGGTAVAGRSGHDDLGSCFTVNLPVTLVDNTGQNIVVSDMSQYNLVLSALRHRGNHDGDDDNGDDDNHNGEDHPHYTVVFPITLTMADATTLTVNTQDELHAAVHSCHDDSDDIDCLEIHFPITITYTDANNATSTVTFTNDDEIYTFLITLIGSESITINYPMTITDSNGNTVSIENNEQLQAAIETAASHCGHHEGEGDDDHGGDDDGDDDNGGDDDGSNG